MKCAPVQALCFDVRGQQGWTFFTGGSIIMDTGVIFWQKQQFKVKKSCLLKKTCSFSLHKMLINGLEWCELLVDYCDVFSSCLDSHSDGTHSLQRIYWWASDGMLHFYKSVPMKKQTLGVRKFRQIFIFGRTVPLSKIQTWNMIEMILKLCEKCFKRVCFSKVHWVLE